MDSVAIIKHLQTDYCLAFKKQFMLQVFISMRKIHAFLSLICPRLTFYMFNWSMLNYLTEDEWRCLNLFTTFSCLSILLHNNRCRPEAKVQCTERIATVNEGSNNCDGWAGGGGWGWVTAHYSGTLLYSWPQPAPKQSLKLSYVFPSVTKKKSGPMYSG